MALNKCHVVVVPDNSGGGWWNRVRLVRDDRQSIGIRQFLDPQDAIKYGTELADFLGTTVSGV